MKSAGKIFSEAANYEGEPIANSLSHIFARYKVEQFSWAHKEGEKSKG